MVPPRSTLSMLCLPRWDAWKSTTSKCSPWFDELGGGLCTEGFLFLSPFLCALSSWIACSRIWMVISLLHIGQRCYSIWFEPDSHFIMQLSWNMCLQLGIFRMSFPFLNSSIQITHSEVPNSSISLLFLYFRIGISFLYWSISDSWTFLLISSLSAAFILL